MDTKIVRCCILLAMHLPPIAALRPSCKYSSRF